MLKSLLQLLPSLLQGISPQPQTNPIDDYAMLAALTQQQKPYISNQSSTSNVPDWVPQQYRDLILSSASKHNVPVQVLSGLLHQESRFNPIASNKIGASGIAQFMPATAKQYGIDPYDPNQAIPAAAQFLASNYKKAGNWEDALAGYNAGPGRMDRRIWSKIPETSNYVSSIMNKIGPLQSTPAPQPYQDIDPRLLAILLK